MHTEEMQLNANSSEKLIMGPAVAQTFACNTMIASHQLQAFIGVLVLLL